MTEGLGIACKTTVPADTLQSLRDMGRAISPEPPDNAFGFGGAQLIQRTLNGTYAGGSNPRKEGAAVKF